MALPTTTTEAPARQSLANAILYGDGGDTRAAVAPPPARKPHCTRCGLELPEHKPNCKFAPANVAATACARTLAGMVSGRGRLTARLPTGPQSQGCSVSE